MNETSTKLKICGITSLADARYCAGAGVDYLGFIQYKDSPRYIEPAQAKEIIGWLYGPEPVGVFVNETAASINQLVADVGFTHAQIHGDYEPAFFKDISAKTIKAVSIHPHTSPEELKAQFSRYAEGVDFFLLDTAKAGLWGGTGTPFNWEVAKEIVQDYPTFIAGGIDALNILQVIETLHPYAVDLASGVEESPGVKDFDKLADLFEAFQSLNT